MKTSALLLLASAALAAGDPDYQLHEWGTFTTVAGSDGVLLAGLEREETELPRHVHAHFGLENGQSQDQAEVEKLIDLYGAYPLVPTSSKGMGRRPLAGVTVKMETPVLYFHSPAGFHAKVKVGFNGGSISQWYPARSGGEKLPVPPRPADPKHHPTPVSAWTLDFNKPYQGSIEWDVDVLSPEDSRNKILFKPDDTLNWVRARVPDANLLKTAAGETEGYLFYRGIGHFDPGLKTSVTPDEILHLENRTGGKIPWLVAFERTADGNLHWIERRAGLDADASFEIPEAAMKEEAAGFCEPLYRAVKAGLADCGLTDEEARAMVETWWTSYFEAPGLRVFWVLPRPTTDRILPLQVSPAPASLVRVLVGRSEIFRPREEKSWLGQAAQSEKSGWTYTVANNRFGGPMQSRVASLQQPKK